MNINATEMRKIANEKLKIRNEDEFKIAMKIIEKRIKERSSKGNFVYVFRNNNIVASNEVIERIIAHLEYQDFKVKKTNSFGNLIISW